MLVLAEPKREAVRSRWARAAGLGVREESDAFPVGTSDSDLVVRRDRLEDVFREERALLGPMVADLAAHSLLVIVADADGIVLAAHGDGSADPTTRVRLVEGACWSERARGTNAIGTAIVERRSIAVLGDAHYEVRNRGLFCYATPIFDAYGDLVAVLDVTGPMAAHDASLGVAVRTAGAAIERAIQRVARRSVGRSALDAIGGLMQRSPSPTLLVEASGVVGALNGAARSALSLGEVGSLTCDRLFGVPFADLSALALSGGGGMRFETRSSTYRLELEPITGEGGRVLAVLVHLEPPALVRRAAPAPKAPAPRAAGPFAAILGSDESLARARENAARFAATGLPVLLLGETGTGKELFARAIHEASPRAKGPLVALNCGGLTPALLESELFGYAPGSFTGASRAGAEGRLAAAHGGTLFLDEVAEMPEAVQATLLRVLDDGFYHRVGDPRPRRADFRLVAATCRDLPDLVTRGLFRRDLFYRIHGACVTLPPLRDRSDAVELAEALLARLVAAGSVPPGLAPEARRWIAEHPWPGNVREQKSALVHALALGDGAPILDRSHFPAPLPVASGPAPVAAAAPRTRDAILQDVVRETVRACAGNLSEAARRLGVARSTIYRTLRGRP